MSISYPSAYGARGWLTGSICPVPHDPLTPSSAEEGSYFHNSRWQECFSVACRFCSVRPPSSFGAFSSQ
jgi:hypothetical protein